MSLLEILEAYTKWELLIVNDRGVVKAWDDYKLYGRAFADYVDAYKDTEVKEYVFTADVLAVEM